MIRRFFLMFLLLMPALTCFSMEPYIGINVIAPFTSAGEGYGSYRRYVPLFSNNEYGLAVSGGIILQDHHKLEARISFGSPHGIDFSRLFQLHFGYRFLLLDYFDVTPRGLYAGGSIRFSFIRYPRAGVSYFTIMPDICAGYHLTLKQFFFDAMISLPFGALSWSSARHTKAGAKFFLSPAANISPVLPLASFVGGWEFSSRK
ncbi:MAG: hypothetical protein ACLFSE_14095 [Spirochaetia bacterium]